MHIQGDSKLVVQISCGERVHWTTRNHIRMLVLKCLPFSIRALTVLPIGYFLIQISWLILLFWNGEFPLLFALFSRSWNKTNFTNSMNCRQSRNLNVKKRPTGATLGIEMWKGWMTQSCSLALSEGPGGGGTFLENFDFLIDITILKW